MATYTASVAGRDGKGWVVRLPDIGPDAVIQTTRLGDIADEARSRIALALDVAPSQVEIAVDYESFVGSPGLQSRADKLRTSREKLREFQEELDVETKEIVASLTAAGVPKRDIADLVGLSYQWITKMTPKSEADDAMGAALAEFTKIEEQR